MRSTTHNALWRVGTCFYAILTFFFRTTMVASIMFITAAVKTTGPFSTVLFFVSSFSTLRALPWCFLWRERYNHPHST